MGECKLNAQNEKCIQAAKEIITEEKLTPVAQQLIEEIPKLFTRKRHVKTKNLKLNERRRNVFPTKWRRITIQLRNQVDREIEKLLNDGHIEKVNTHQNEVFIQPAV